MLQELMLQINWFCNTKHRRTVAVYSQISVFCLFQIQTSCWEFRVKQVKTLNKQ